MQKDYTREGVVEIIDRNENFSCRQADFAKVRLYHRIKAELGQVRDCTAGGYKPNPHEQNALLWLDMPEPIILHSEAAGSLARAIIMADRVSFCTSGGKIRVCLGVEKVWQD